MAGTLKPNNVKKEGKWLVNGFKAHTNTTINCLFDSERGAWNSGKAFYWLTVGEYIDITLYQTSAIWVLPNLNYLNYNAPLTVSKWDGSSFVSIGDTPPRPTTDTWSRMIKLDAGRYRFTLSSSYRLDDEWYIEEINDKILLSSNNKTYSLETIDTTYETKMTSNSNPSPIVASSSSEYNSVYQAWKAFDGLTYAQSNSSYWWSSGIEAEKWIQLEFGSSKNVNNVTITNSYNSTYIIKDFYISASNDGVNFTLLAKYKEDTSFSANVTKKFVFTNYKKYRYYRITVTKPTSGEIVGIQEIKFGYKGILLVELPIVNKNNFIQYGQFETANNLDALFTEKNYILQDTVSKNEQGLWTAQLNRKPLSIKFD